MPSFRQCGAGRDRPHVIILGAGPAGLSAAWRLSGKGVRVVVIEQSHLVGGLCSTVEYGGFRFDLGGHRFISKDASLVESVKGLMGDELLVANRKSAVRLMGREFCYPLRAADLLGKLDMRYIIRCLVDCIRMAGRRRPTIQKGTSLEDWLISCFGRTLYQIFFEEYTAKLWGIPPHELSADWAVSRIPVLNLWDTLLKTIHLRNGLKGGHAARFFYPRRGIGQIFEFMARDVEARGGRILRNSTIKKVLLKKGRAEEVIFLREGREEAVAGRFIVSTLPLPVLVQCLDTGGSTRNNLLNNAEQLVFRSLRFLNLMIDRPAVSDNTWMYVPEEQYLTTRIQEPGRRSPYNCPDGKTSLILEIPCSYGDETWNMKGGALRERCLKDLSGMGIDVEDTLIDSFITGARYAYPVYRIGYRHPRREILEFISGIPNLLTCGRGGLFRYLFMDQAMNGGLHAAESILRGRETAQPLSEAHYLIESQSVIT